MEVQGELNALHKVTQPVPLGHCLSLFMVPLGSSFLEARLASPLPRWAPAVQGPSEDTY